MMDLGKMLIEHVGDGSRERVQANICLIHMCLETSSPVEAATKQIVNCERFVASLVDLARSASYFSFMDTMAAHTLWHLRDELGTARVASIEADLGFPLENFSAQRLNELQLRMVAAMAGLDESELSD